MPKIANISVGFHVVSGRHRLEPDPLAEAMYEQDPGQLSPADIAERHDDQRGDIALAMEALEELPPPLRKVFERVYLDDRSFSEIEEEFPTLQGRVRRMHTLAVKMMGVLFRQKQEEANARIISFPVAGCG